MTIQLYDVGLIPCTANKNPHGLTPLTLYKGGPLSLMVRHARQRCKRIVIMSAKYGLLEEDAQVQYYDTFIGDLTMEQKLDLIDCVREDLDCIAWKKATVLSYLWKPYWAVFQQANESRFQLNVRTPYMGIPSLILYKILSNELKSDIARR